MKKTILLILFICLFCITKAQLHQFTGGVLFDFNGIGLLGNTGQFWNSTKDNDGAGHGGLSCGIFVKREFTETLYSTFELRYSSKGSYYGFVSQYGTDASESLYLSYIETPLLIGYKYKPLKRTFYLECGLEFSKLISSKIEVGDQLPISGTPSNKNFKNYDLSLIGSLKFPIVRKWQDHFLFGIRMTRSIPTIHKFYKIYNFEYGIEFNYLFK